MPLSIFRSQDTLTSEATIALLPGFSDSRASSIRTKEKSQQLEEAANNPHVPEGKETKSKPCQWMKKILKLSHVDTEEKQGQYDFCGTSQLRALGEEKQLPVTSLSSAGDA
ncbi:unnamed protein product [Natator depressus]